MQVAFQRLLKIKIGGICWFTEALPGDLVKKTSPVRETFLITNPQRKYF